MTGCVFCAQASRVPGDAAVLTFDDGHPVTPGHTLLVPRRHVASVFDMRTHERDLCYTLIDLVRERLTRDDPTIRGWNVGFNDGVVAGQTVFHAHVHLIPRRAGDVADPRGGVRGVIPARQSY